MFSKLFVEVFDQITVHIVINRADKNPLSGNEILKRLSKNHELMPFDPFSEVNL